MRKAILFTLLITITAATGCSRAPSAVSNAEAANPHDPLKVEAPVVVYKNATCGCCEGWVKHLRQAGFNVEARDVDNLAPIKEHAGIPYGMGSCHTAQIGGYFIEGHVPAEDIKRLLAERRKAKGLVVPAMPIGSPGMENPSGKTQPYDVILVREDGETSVFAHHGS